MEKICYIIGAVKAEKIFIPDANNSFIIAADAGYKILQSLGITPNLTVGDFDSLGEVPQGVGEVITHPVEKDDTDTLLAVKEGLRRGYKTFVIYGGIGGRLDHTVANIQTLAYIAQNGGLGYLLCDDFAVTVIKDGKICFDGSQKGNISVFAMGENANEVCEKGLKYSLNNASLTPMLPLGVSNQFTGSPAEISVSSGMISVMWDCEPKDVIDMILSK